MFCRVSRIGEPIESSGATGAAEALASLAWKGLLKRASDRERSVVRQLMRARIAHESLDQLEQCRPLGWASPHAPAPILIGHHRKVLHGLHVSQHTSAIGSPLLDARQNICSRWEAVNYALSSISGNHVSIYCLDL